MATIADYVVLSDNAKVLKVGSDINETFSFSLPAHVNRDSRAVATWQFEAEGTPNSLGWNLQVNGTQIPNYTHGSDRFCALQEVFAGSVLQAGANTAKVTVTGGTGQIKFSDFVIHFQANV